MAQYQTAEIIQRGTSQKVIKHEFVNTLLQAQCCTLHQFETTEAKALGKSHAVITKYEKGEATELKFYI